MAREVHFILSTVKRFEKATNASKRKLSLWVKFPKRKNFVGLNKIPNAHIKTLLLFLSLKMRSNIFKRDRFTVSSQIKCERKMQKEERKKPLRLLI